jgi:hypothetical protein
MLSSVKQSNRDASLNENFEEHAMRKLNRGVYAVGLLSVGYILGASGAFSPSLSNAQEAAADAVSKETLEKVRTANDAVAGAMAALEQEKGYVPAIVGINSFATTAGGLNAVQDLETGRGVDPETFAGLYSGHAVAEVAEHLGKDDEGRVTYKSKVVRMYPISRLKELFDQRAKQIGAKPAAGEEPKQ